MSEPINDSQRIRVIRAILGMTSKALANELGVSTNALTSWEKNKYSPRPENRHELARLCKKNEIGFTPSGMPVPMTDVFTFRKKESRE